MHLTGPERSANKELIDLVRRELTARPGSFSKDDMLVDVYRQSKPQRVALERPIGLLWLDRLYKRMKNSAPLINEPQMQLWPDLPYMPKVLSYRRPNGSKVEAPLERTSVDDAFQWLEQDIARNMHRVAAKHAHQANFLDDMRKCREIFGDVSIGDLMRLSLETKDLISNG